MIEFYNKNKNVAKNINIFWKRNEKEFSKNCPICKTLAIWQKAALCDSILSTSMQKRRHFKYSIWKSEKNKTKSPPKRKNF